MPWNERHGTAGHFGRKTDQSLVPHDQGAFKFSFKVWK